MGSPVTDLSAVFLLRPNDRGCILLDDVKAFVKLVMSGGVTLAAPAPALPKAHNYDPAAFGADQTASIGVVGYVQTVLGPIDPQIAGLPAASIAKVPKIKPVEHVFDLTLILADVSEKAIEQVKRGAVELLTPQMEDGAARARSRWWISPSTTTCGARSILLMISRSERVMAGPPLRGILSPSATSMT